MISEEFIDKFVQIAKSPEPDLATAALFIARLEYPRLDASRYLRQLDLMGAVALQRLGPPSTDVSPVERIEAFNSYLYIDQGFAGNKSNYNDPRDSFLNEVLDRRTGIPITLALVYIEIARRAGLVVDGINFPGHFLLRMRRWSDTSHDDTDLIVDPFHGGAILSETDCRRLLRDHSGAELDFNPKLLMRATKQQILIRMLVNLKRIYVGMRSFPQGRDITDLLLALNPSVLTELRDRGLFSYHLNDFAAALRDLEAYLRFTSRGDGNISDGSKEHEEIWEHVKTLRRRVASLN